MRAGIALAVLAAVLFSTSSIFVRLAAPISPVEITFGRMAVAAATAGAGWRLFGRGQRFPAERRYLAYGLIAALHFLLFVAALSYTTVAHALAITYLSPVFVALAQRWLFGEKLRPAQQAGIALALAGITVMVGFQPLLTRRMLVGDGLALLSAGCYAAYSLAGRGERRRYRLLPYATAVYGLAAVWLLPAFAASFLAGAGAAAYRPSTVLAVLASGFVPLGLGHTLYNASLRRMPAAYSNLLASQEVTGGIILAALVLGELPPASAVLGALLALAGIALVLLRAPGSSLDPVEARPVEVTRRRLPLPRRYAH